MSISRVGVVDVLLEAARLKALDRAGWVRCGIPRPESVAAHSWGVSWLVLALLPEDLDSGRALSYAVLHDLPEVRVGDLVPSDKVDATAKSHREHAAMAALCRDLPGGERLLARPIQRRVSCDSSTGWTWPSKPWPTKRSTTPTSPSSWTRQQRQSTTRRSYRSSKSWRRGRPDLPTTHPREILAVPRGVCGRGPSARGWPLPLGGWDHPPPIPHLVLHFP
ncbi:MAG: HD domain-containing protein [Deltaproteobacteria bacterium]|nr:HD domain-containing protein [Deltaproteobacteria bacterium]